MTALKQSLKGGDAPPRKAKRLAKKAIGQRELLFPIAGKKPAAAPAKKTSTKPAAKRKAG